MASSAVHPVALDDDDDDGATTEDAPSVLASSAAQAWPSVSDGSDDDSMGDAVDENAAASPNSPKSPEPRNADDEGEVLEPEEVGPAVAADGRGGTRARHDSRVSEEEEIALEREIVSNLEDSTADFEQVPGSVWNPEGVTPMRSDLEEGSSSGSVVNGDRGLGSQELAEDWLGVEDASSSARTGAPETHDFEYTPAKTTNLGSKRVYTFPRSEEVAPAAADVGSQMLAWPVGIAIEIIGFQVKLMLQMVSVTLWLCSVSFAAFMFPLRAFLKATNAAVATASDGYTLATQIKPMLEGGVARAGPALRRTTKKCGFGCLAAAYVMFMLGFLLVPALFLDLFLVRGLIEEPVEFRQVLHFDYRQEHPSATVSLLPPHVLAKIKDNVYPEKVLRYRPIPPSHKLQVTIFLTLPESRYNLELGMFQVSAELLSVRGSVIKRASWPCMLRYQSSSLRYAKQIILGVPLLMGISKEAQMLALRLFENEEKTKTPTATVRFIMEPKAGFPPGQGLPQVYSAEAHIVSVLPWTKDILRRWKWTFYVWSGLSLFMFEVMVVLCCCHQVLLPSQLLRGITEGLGESEPTVKGTAAKRTGKPGRRVNFSDELPTARALREPVDKLRERELLLESAESRSSTISGPRLRRLPTPPAAANAAGLRSEASSSSRWGEPPLETLDYVGGKVEAVEESVKSLGESVVKHALDPKTFKFE